MTNYLWVIETLKRREWVPYSVRKTKEGAELVLANNERSGNGKFRIRKYLRRLE